MKKILFFVSAAIICFSVTNVNAQNTDAYKAGLLDYLTASGGLASLDVTFDQLLTMIGSGLSVQQKTDVKKQATEKLIDLMVPVYMNHISLDDLEAANAFFSTAAGKRISTAQPLIIKETTQVSMQWASEVQGMIQNAGK
jgi:uncharacterized protein